MALPHLTIILGTSILTAEVLSRPVEARGENSRESWETSQMTVLGPPEILPADSDTLDLSIFP